MTHKSIHKTHCLLCCFAALYFRLLHYLII